MESNFSTQSSSQNNMINVYMLTPSGFCAGVDRAITVVEKALQLYGAPIFVKHQIVHNKNVINDLKNKGVIFINDLEELPEGAVLIFNAHGVTKNFEEMVISKNITYIDATCPLVKKVHREAEVLESKNFTILVIGHKDHPEVIATTSRIKQNAIIIDSLEAAHNFIPNPEQAYSFVTQTTLSVDFINEITQILQQKIPNLTPSKNICYATQNRQGAIKSVLNHIDCLIVVGSKNSSNSNRLMELGSKQGILSYLVDHPEELPLNEIKNCRNIALSAGASSPPASINKVLHFLQNNLPCNVINHQVQAEDVKFVLPKQLRNV